MSMNGLAFTLAVVLGFVLPFLNAPAVAVAVVCVVALAWWGAQ